MMNDCVRKSWISLWFVFLFITNLFASAHASLPESTPYDDFVIREEMIPMRDGVRLYTVIVFPKVSNDSLPMLFERTPWDASGKIIANDSTPKLKDMLGEKYIDKDYIYAIQDIRGRCKSEGDFSMYRPLRGQFNQTETDEATDAWDSIEWLLKNVSCNGHVGILGESYGGWLALAALRNPHPAITASVVTHTDADFWKDTFFHWGAFKGLESFEFSICLESNVKSFTDFPYPSRDKYDWMLKQGSVGTNLSTNLDERNEMWKILLKYPDYGPYWRELAADRWFDSPSRIVPTLFVHGLFDQCNINGTPAAYAAMEKHDKKNDKIFFAATPSCHDLYWKNGRELGSLQFGEDTTTRYTEDVLKPFLRKFMHNEELSLSPVTVFDTGINRWRHFDAWPPESKTVRLYLQPEAGVSFELPILDTSFTEYVSDPAKAIPYAPRPHWGDERDQRWRVEDQRFVHNRPDVLTWVSEPLSEPISVRGPVTAHVFAETTGTDADWVVKFIDVYSDIYHDVDMSGYQLMVSADIFRGRYRENYEEPHPIKPNEVFEYTIPMPHLNHTFKEGHRFMVQIQSTWFPKYDSNPQTYVDSIMFAPDDSYRKQTHRIHHSEKNPTFLEFHID